MQQKKLILVGIAVMMVAAILTGCGNKVTASNVKLGQAEQGKLLGDISISGTLAPKESAVVSTQIAGLITAVPVKEGSVVKQGQLLVQLDAKDSQAQVAKSETKISQTQYTIAQAKTTLDDATRDLARYQQLYTAGGISEKQLETYKTAWTNAKLNYDSAVNGTMPSAQEDEKIAALTLNKSRIVSPIDGIVVAVSANKGENVLPGTGLITVVNTGSLQLTGNIDEAEVSSIALGQQCSLSADAVPGKKFTAQVSFVSPISLSSGSSYPVRLQVANVGGVLRAGMNATADIKVSQSGFILPEKAVFAENGKSYVFIKNNGKADKTAVMTGLRSAGKVVVLSGIQQSSQIVVQGAEGMLDGDKLK